MGVKEAEQAIRSFVLVFARLDDLPQVAAQAEAGLETLRSKLVAVKTEIEALPGEEWRGVSPEGRRLHERSLAELDGKLAALRKRLEECESAYVVLREKIRGAA